MNLNKALHKRIKDSYVPISVICTKTGLSQQVIYASLSEKGKRKLRADELLKICRFLKINPNELIETQQNF